MFLYNIFLFYAIVWFIQENGRVKKMNDVKNCKTALPPDTFLPKKLTETEEGRKILSVLSRHLISLIPGNDYRLPSFQMSQPIMEALYSARRTGRLIRGLEDAEKKLNAERAGIVKVDNKTGSDRKVRISRLVVVANDGSERFYRQTKKLIERNRPRALAIYLNITSFELGERLFGPGKRVLFLLISHKDSVVDFLTSLTR